MFRNGHGRRSVLRVRPRKREKQPVTRANILVELKSERDRLHRAISALEGNAPRRGRPKKAQVAIAPRGRRMSAESRRRISEAKRKWWAERKKKR